MSRSPMGASAPVNSLSAAWSRRASSAPRVWMPTIAKASGAGFFSAISWAIRRSVRLRSSRSSTTFSLADNFASFLASQGLVKGRPQRSKGWGLFRRFGLLDGLARVVARKLFVPRTVAFPGAAWDEGRLSALGEGDFDDVEIPRRHARLKDVAGLVEDRADVVAGGDVDQREHLYVGLAGDGGGLAHGRVAGVGGSLHLLLGEAGVMDEEVGVGRRRDG